jgi:hypothetical protein
MDHSQSGTGLLSPYYGMVMESYEAPEHLTILSAISHSIILTGFVFLPEFTTSLTIRETEAGRLIQSAVRIVPLLVLGGIFWVAGGIGVSWAAWKMRRNYVWLNGHIFL